MLKKMFAFFVVLYSLSIQSYVYAFFENVEFSSSVGYTQLNSFNLEKAAPLFTTFKGYHLELDGFYNFNSENSLVMLTTGLGMKVINAAAENSSPNIENINSTKTSMTSFSVPLYLGLKSNFNSPFSFYLLGTAGYNFADDISLSINKNAYYNNSSFKTSKHHYFGFKLASLYSLTTSLSIGLNFNFNRHYMLLDYNSNSYVYTESTYFNEYSTGISFNYTF